MREPTEMELRVVAAMKKQALTDSSFEILTLCAIRAMREPTKNMITCGDSRFYVGREQSRAIWQAMIDAASPPDSGEGQ